jgi:hypothetical protein
MPMLSQRGLAERLSASGGAVGVASYVSSRGSRWSRRAASVTTRDEMAEYVRCTHITHTSHRKKIRAHARRTYARDYGGALWIHCHCASDQCQHHCVASTSRACPSCQKQATGEAVRGMSAFHDESIITGLSKFIASANLFWERRDVI